MDRSTLIDDIAGLGDGLNDVAGGLTIFDLESIRLGCQDAELACDDNDEVGGGGAVLRSVSQWSCSSRHMVQRLTRAPSVLGAMSR